MPKRVELIAHKCALFVYLINKGDLLVGLLLNELQEMNETSARQEATYNLLTRNYSFDDLVELLVEDLLVPEFEEDLAKCDLRTFQIIYRHKY